MVPIPLKDHIRRRTFWLFTLVLIVANVWAFLAELSLGRDLNSFIFLYGLTPARYTNPRIAARVPAELSLLSIFVSMFLHGGWLHLIGNMLFLFVFGRSIEDRYGHWRFLLIYLLAGFGG